MQHCVVMLSVVMLNVSLLNVVASFQHLVSFKTKVLKSDKDKVAIP
jgi:hypothetical protein